MGYRVPKSKLTPINGGVTTVENSKRGDDIPNILDKYGDEGVEEAKTELMTYYHTNKGCCNAYTTAYGSGWWDVIHRLAKDATNLENGTYFIAFMDFACKEFKCPVCRKHLIGMWSSYRSRISSFYLDDKNYKKLHFGMFFITWKMHNEVNARINKPLMGWADAVQIFYGDNTSVEPGQPCDIEVCPP